MYKDKVIVRKREFIPTITDSMIPVDFCQKNKPIINFTPDDMTSKFELFSKNKINTIYITESMLTYWLQMLDKYWNKVDTPYSSGFYF